jgi:transcriptional regulator GlxA family with amidase domain
MSCDPHLSRPILNGLPPVFKVNVRTDSSGLWLENSIVHLVDEAASGRVGSEAMLTKLSEALFVDTLRRYVDSLPQQQSGWLAGARDPVVGRSLALLHGRVAHPWTIADLADQVGTSRSALVERFSRYLFEPPMTYLTRWRLQLAAESLKQTSRGVADIATDIGYQSEAAFQSRVQTGVRPASRRISDRPQGFAAAIRRDRVTSACVIAPEVLTIRPR